MKLFVRNYNKEMCSLKHKILEFSLLAEDTWRPKMVNNFQPYIEQDANNLCNVYFKFEQNGEKSKKRSGTCKTLMFRQCWCVPEF